MNHEYALFFGKSENATIGRLPISEGQQAFFSESDDAGPFAWQNLRKRGGANTFRKARPKQYFPLYAKPQEFRVPKIKWNETSREWDILEQPKEDEVVVFPIGIDGRERIWSLSPQKILSGEEEFEVREESENEYTIWRKIRPNPEGSLPSTWWDSNKYSIVEHGAAELERILNRSDRPFPFPKSPFSVLDSLRVAGVGSPKALVVDFFAGSGTTLHAVNLLNAEDNGKRRCILVTNNEVSEEEAKQLKKQGFLPGDDAWEQQGICRAVTWPRSKYTILGRRDDGSELEGDYITGQTTTKEKARTFRRLGFIDPAALATAARKKEIVSLIDAIPMSHIKPDTAFFVSADERHTAAILFDDTQADAFLDALEEMDHITHFYIVSGSNKRFRQLKEQIEALLGPIDVQEEEKRPMRDGFPANLAYFKLDFLEKDEVALGRQFRQILPLLWLRAGAGGPRPELPDDNSLPAMLLPAQNHFAVLLDETRFADFRDAVANRPDLSHIFLVTDSADTFRDMAAQLEVPHVIQLYRDYLENFTINQEADRLVQS